MAVALYSPMLVANILWLIYAAAALVALGTIATTSTKDYTTHTWTPRKTVRPQAVNAADTSKVVYSKKNGVVVGYTL
ncbi:MAG TPA: hypothetical protein PLC12_05960 [Candidatus Methanofastidiosa archaeon]|nr:hypothetical protein [Candidatus Methanofastidiosa archaeon]